MLPVSLAALLLSCASLLGAPRPAWSAAAAAAAAAAAPPQPPVARGLRVIGAGLPATGTQSLLLALEELGFSPCHGYDFLANTTLRAEWSRHVHLGGPVEPALSALLESGFDATMDNPTALAWRELAGRHPEAKVILSVRDDAERWYRSLAGKGPGQSGLFGALFGLMGRLQGLDLPGYGDFTRRNQRLYGCDFAAAQTPELRASCISGYLRHNEEVQAALPPERLLTFNVKEGWRPLCDFLRVPVPDKPFPRRDWSKGWGLKELREILADRKARAFLVPAVLLAGGAAAAGLCALGCAARCLWRRHRRGGGGLCGGGEHRPKAD